MIDGPLVYRWSGEAMEPLPRFHNVANAKFVVGETYALDEVHERSTASHGHYFATLNDLWRNLPEHQAERWPTVDHFRRWLLIKAGYRDERTLVCASKAEALRLAAFVRPMDPYAVVVVRDAVVTVLTAKSQSYRAMGRKDFQESKDAVLGFAAEVIGVELSSSQRSGGVRSPAEVA